MASWRTVALIPDLDLDFPLRGEVEVGNGVILTRIPAWLDGARISDDLRWPQIDLIAGRPRFALIRSYEADGLRDPEPTWDDPRDMMTRQQYALHLLMVANLAVWLVQPATTLRFRNVLHLEQQADGSWWVAEWDHPDARIANRPVDVGLTPDDLAKARALNILMVSLRRDGPIWVALRSEWGGLTQGWFHNRYMLLWIGLEALFGPREPGEVRFRLSQNLAFFLAESREAQRRLFDAVRKDYDKRSLIAHGELGKVKPTEWQSLMIRAEDWSRSGIVRILEDSEYREVFSSSKRRDDFFRQLVIGPSTGSGGT